MKEPGQLEGHTLPWRHDMPTARGLKALDFLERSREMADDPVTAAPRPIEIRVPGGTGTP